MSPPVDVSIAPRNSRGWERLATNTRFNRRRIGAPACSRLEIPLIRKGDPTAPKVISRLEVGAPSVTRRVLHGLLLSLIVGFLAGCGDHQAPKTLKLGSLAPAQVHVVIAESSKRALTEEVLGTVRAKLRATLEAKVSGRISSLPVVLGQKVTKDQLLVRLDADEIKARLELAQATLDQAERDWQRISSLFDGQAISRSEYDNAQSRLQVGKAARAEAQAMMGYVEVTAPFEGVITKKWLDVGDLAAPGKPLLDIEVPSALQLEADVPEGIAARVKEGDKLAVKVDSVDGEVLAKLTEMAPSADPVSRTFQVKLDLPGTAGLMAGQFARLLVPVGELHCVSVPSTALVQRGQLEIVFVLANQRAQMRLVKSGRHTDKEVDILSGVEAGEQIIVENPALLIDGQPVEAK